MNDRDVLLIEWYIHENFSYPFNDATDSYSRWAVEEILKRTIDEAMKLPAHITGIEPMTLMEVVEIFIDEMDYYSYSASTDEARSIFSVAREEAKLVLDYIHSYKRKETNE